MSTGRRQYEVSVLLMPGYTSGYTKDETVLGFAAFVGDASVRVRYTPGRRAGHLRCDVHGSHGKPTCSHEHAAWSVWLDHLHRDGATDDH